MSTNGTRPGIAGLQLPKPQEIGDWLLRGIKYALDNHPRVPQVRFLLLQPPIVLEAVRKNEVRNAEIRMMVPDEIARDLRDQALSDKGDVYALVAIPREAMKRADSLLVMPGERR